MGEGRHSLSAVSLGTPQQGQGCLASPGFWKCHAWATEMFHSSSTALGAQDLTVSPPFAGSGGRWCSSLFPVTHQGLSGAPRRFGAISGPRRGGPLIRSRILCSPPTVPCPLGFSRSSPLGPISAALTHWQIRPNRPKRERGATSIRAWAVNIILASPTSACPLGAGTQACFSHRAWHTVCVHFVTENWIYKNPWPQDHLASLGV